TAAPTVTSERCLDMSAEGPVDQLHQLRAAVEVRLARVDSPRTEVQPTVDGPDREAPSRAERARTRSMRILERDTGRVARHAGRHRQLVGIDPLPRVQVDLECLAEAGRGAEAS